MKTVGLIPEKKPQKPPKLSEQKKEEPKKE